MFELLAEVAVAEPEVLVEIQEPKMISRGYLLMMPLVELVSEVGKGGQTGQPEEV